MSLDDQGYVAYEYGYSEDTDHRRFYNNDPSNVPSGALNNQTTNLGTIADPLHHIHNNQNNQSFHRISYNQSGTTRSQQQKHQLHHTQAHSISHQIDEQLRPNRVSKNIDYSQDHDYYQTKPPFKYSYTTPIHSYNSEWIDTPEISPSKQVPIYHQMTAAQQLQIESHNQTYKSQTPPDSKMETPSKSKSYTFATPGDKANDININEKQLDDKTSSTSSEDNENPVPIKQALRAPIKVSNWDVFWVMLNDVTGKDKLAKISQYVLKLLLYHAEKSQTYLSDNYINIDVISSRYNNREKQLNLIRNFLRHPQNFIRIVSILVCSIFRERLAGMVNGLSMYRQFLRFGRSPFRIHGLVKKFSENIHMSKDTTVNVNYPKLFNRSTLSEIFGVYYSVSDETSLLLKLKFYDHPKIKELAAKHEALAWYYDTWLNLYNAYEKSQQLSQQEMDLKIQIEVTNKAKILSKQLLGGHPIQVSNVPSKVSAEDSKLLNSIQFKKHNAYLDIYKNISDLIFNTYTVFNLALPFDMIQVWMGISASGLSTIKIYRETKARLLEEARQNAT